MRETKDAFWANYKKVDEQLKILDENSERYEILLKERDNIRNEILKLEQIEAENKREKYRNIISCTTFGVSLIVGGWSFLRTLQFDESSTLTSTNGRPIVNNFVSKMLMFKR